MVKILFDFVYNLVKEVEEKLIPSAKILRGIKRSIQLDGYSCAVQCVYSTLNYYNVGKSINVIKSALGTSKNEGTDTQPIVNFLTSQNFVADINERASINDIEKAINMGFPILITIYNWEHWVLIYGYSENRIFLLDSNKFRILNSIKREEFLKIWDDNWIAVMKHNKYINGFTGS